MTTLTCHAAVRLFPPTNSDFWYVLNLANKIKYRCSRLAAMLLVAFIGGANRRDVFLEFERRYRFEESILHDSVATLVQLKLLVEPNDESHLRSRELCKHWSRYGWVDTADYQLATLDYPFADYAQDGRQIDFDRMREYTREEPDTKRYKQYTNVETDGIAAPETGHALARLREPFKRVWKEDAELQLFTKERCLILMSAVFGALKWRRLSNRPELIADAIHKTSPSGGARHPTEAYFFACSINGLNTGIYHFNVGRNSLDLIADLDSSESALMSMFSGPMRASFRIDGFIVMTSVLERSMWRYREPRSFRAIYMDVGHICATLDVVAKTLGLNCLVQHGVSEQPIASLLGLHPLTEGVIYGAALGGSRARQT